MADVEEQASVDALEAKKEAERSVGSESSLN